MFIDRTAIKSTATCAQKLDPHITHTRPNNTANEFRAGDDGRGRRHALKLKIGGVGVGACECGKEGGLGCVKPSMHCDGE